MAVFVVRYRNRIEPAATTATRTIHVTTNHNEPPPHTTPLSHPQLLHTSHTTHFGLDFSDPKQVPGVEDIKQFIHKAAAKPVQTRGGEL